MRVGPRIKELCAALEGMGSATAAEIHRAVRREIKALRIHTGAPEGGAKQMALEV